MFAGVIVWLVMSRHDSKEGPMPDLGTASAVVTSDELTTATQARVFFGHQSVGMNILEGVPGVFSQHGVPGPDIQQGRTAPTSLGGFIEQDAIGENTQPMKKIQDFDAAIRGGLGKDLDVAMMKFCYVDIAPTTDVNALFTAYRDTISALERDYPTVTFIKVTVPVTAEPGLLSKVKARVLGGGEMSQAASVQRQRLNELIRQQYADDHLFDLAAVESTAPDGTRSTGSYQGSHYATLYAGYSSDGGHLNAQGSRIAAAAWLKAIAAAARR
jgi:hypothetical protein